jgi:phenylpropionate dioxygenase-like ring-hydroxylating dioxygenase large terminal subunit
MAANNYIDPALASALDRGNTLPAHWYSDLAIFRAEKERIFHRSWQYAGHIGQVDRPGDFFTIQLGDIRVVITRSNDGTLHAFANVCRHRGSEVVLECSGNRQTLQCHYHGWTYNLDGSLRAAPRENEQRSFAKNELSLMPFAIETWGPLIFVNPSPDAGPLLDLIGGLAPIFKDAGVDLEQLRMLRRDTYELASNWKVVVENFNECYHCPIAHPKFSEVIDTDKYRVVTDNEYFSTYYGPLKSSNNRGVTYATLWPNVMFALSTNPASMQVITARPIDAEHTRQTVDYFFAEDLRDEQIRAYVELSDLVTREDIVLCESVQRGLRSGAIKHGQLMLSRERGIQHFQKLVHRFLTT